MRADERILQTVTWVHGGGSVLAPPAESASSDIQQYSRLGLHGIPVGSSWQGMIPCILVRWVVSSG